MRGQIFREGEDGEGKRRKIDQRRIGKREMNILIEYKYVYPSTDKYRMNERIDWDEEE